MLTVTASSVDRQSLTESAAAIEAGCSTQWTPLRVVGPDEMKDIPGLLAAAGYEVMPLIACIRPATEFVVAHPLVDGQDAGGTVTIELDGCQRLFGTTGFTLVSEEILELVRAK